MPAPQTCDCPVGAGQFAKASTIEQTSIVRDPMAAIKKREATLTAECALVGVTLYPSTNDHGRRTYIVSRWALARELSDLDAVEAWLNNVRGARA